MSYSYIAIRTAKGKAQIFAFPSKAARDAAFSDYLKAGVKAENMLLGEG